MHPAFNLLGFGVIVAIAVGTVMYSLFTSEEQEQHSYSYNSRSNYQSRREEPNNNWTGRQGRNECVICREPITPSDEKKRLPCYHCYHKNCIETWFQTQKSCPECRRHCPP